MRRLVLLLLLGLLVACHRPVTAPDWSPGATGFHGLVTTRDGAPAPGAYVYAYLNNRNGLRGPADFAARVDADGSFQLDLPPGSYYLICRWRATGGTSGPPRSGDAWALHAGNPVAVAAGSWQRADFVLQTIGSQQSMRQGSLTSGDTGFSGRLVDADGAPVTGAFVLAYPDSDYRHSPDWTSLPADSDGRFVLYLPGAGHYCLAARTGTRSQPREGEMYGRLGDGDAGCRTLDSAAIVDIGTIVLRPYRR